MIILHRPPRHLFKNPEIANSEDIEICYQSLQAIIRLLRIYSRHYKYSTLPLTFVHTLASAASVILMKRYIDGTTWDEDSTSTVSRPLDLVLEAVDGISQTWTCARQVRDVIITAVKGKGEEEMRNESPQSFDLMASLMEGEGMGMNLGGSDLMYGMEDVDFGQFVTGDLMDGEGAWDGEFPEQDLGLAYPNYQ